MGLIEQSAKEAGLGPLVGDKLPPSQRTQKDFQRFISNVRALESAVKDQLAQSERELNESLHRELLLREENEVLRNELRQYRLREKIGELQLTVADRTKLLELSDVPHNGDRK
jgi:hypothetical protein